MGGPDMGGLILYGACNGGPGIVRNVPKRAKHHCRYLPSSLLMWLRLPLFVL